MSNFLARIKAWLMAVIGRTEGSAAAVKAEAETKVEDIEKKV